MDEMAPQRSLNKKKTLLIGILVFILASILATYFLIGGGGSQPVRDVNPYGGELARIGEASKSYNDAVSARKNGQYSLAIELYNRALTEVPTLEGRSQIEYEIGATQNFMGDPITAVKQLKGVVANESYPDIIRASAAQLMGEIFYWRSDKETFSEIFKDSPYKEMVVPKKRNESLKNLFEYASSFYPLSYSEVKIAEFYTYRLRNILENRDTLPQGMSVEDIKEIIREKIKNAEKDVEDLRKEYPTDVRIYVVLQKKAVIAGIMYLIGDNSFGDPVTLYEDAYHRALIQGYYNQAAFTLYNFAVFLSQADSHGYKERIIKILSDLYTSDDFKKNTSIFEFLKNERNNVTGSKDDILTLASIDPGFKDFLTSLGWSF